ncbi:M-phase phosphoprotein 6 isoform X3 [Pan paniscus]|uniref:M-phase phosphoprotein 6 isoform X3 n=1 Tax=Pan paniscus TaxID=9597 RepID=UPI003005E039
MGLRGGQADVPGRRPAARGSQVLGRPLTSAFLRSAALIPAPPPRELTRASPSAERPLSGRARAQDTGEGRGGAGRGGAARTTRGTQLRTRLRACAVRLAAGVRRWAEATMAAERKTKLSKNLLRMKMGLSSFRKTSSGLPLILHCVYAKGTGLRNQETTRRRRKENH